MALTRITTAIAFGACLLFTHATDASASPITWMVEGRVSFSTVIGVAANDPFTFQVTFDDAASDMDSSAGDGLYNSTGTSLGFSMASGAYSAQSYGRTSTSVHNRDPIAGSSSGLDIYNVSNGAGASGPSFSLNFQQMVQDQFPAASTMLTSDHLLLAPPSFTGVDSFARVTSDAGIVSGRPLTAFRVPEPGVDLLLVLGMGFSGWLVRFRRRPSV